MDGFAEWLGTGNGIAVSCLVGIILAVCLIWFVHWRTAVRAWLGDEVNVLNGLGVPGWFTAPFMKASQGDKPGAISALKTFAANITSAAGLAELDAGYITKAKADATRWARWKAVIADVDSGASFDTIKADLQGAITASDLSKLTPAPTPIGVLRSDVQSAVQNAKAAVDAAIATGNSALGHVGDILAASGQAHMLPLVSIGAQAHAADVAAKADATTTDSTASAASAATTVVSSTLPTVPAGHTATITVTGPAPAAPAPAAA